MHRKLPQQPFLWALAPLLLFIAHFAGASPRQGAEPRPVPQVTAVRTASAPTIDGVLDEAQWQAAAASETFVQVEPDEGKPATQRTEVRFLYDDGALYIGARLHDDGAVTSKLARRDSDLSSDWLVVGLDAHHDRLSGAAFWVNPAGVQRDERMYNDTASDFDWDAVWDAAAHVDERGGWSAEMRIPYSQLRFPEREAHVWGINVWRKINRRNETSAVVMTPRTETGRVSRFADLTGISGITPGGTLEIVPYVTARADSTATVDDDDPLRSQDEYDGELGLDLKWGLSSNLTLTGTLNPDFGQVEVDPAVVNLSQYESFFPEKRPFFIEGADTFRFAANAANMGFNFNIFVPQWFYSRRIGRAPQGGGAVPGYAEFSDVPGETTILGAAKITGRTAGGWNVGILDAVTSSESARIAFDDGSRDDLEVEPLTNYFVGRTSHDFGNKGRVGIFATSVYRDLPSHLDFLRDSAYTGGVDGFWTFGERDYMLEAAVGGTRIEGSPRAIDRAQRSSARYYQRPDAGHVDYDPDAESLSGYMGRLSFTKQTGKWRGNVQMQGYSPGFDVNDVGFMNRVDLFATHAVAMYRNPDPDKRFRFRQHMFSKFQNWNFDGDILANGVWTSNYVQFLNYWEFELGGGYAPETDDDRLTRGGPLARKPTGANAWIWGTTDTRKPISANYNVWTEEGWGGRYNGIALGAVYQPAANVKFSLSPQIWEGMEQGQFIRTVSDPHANGTQGTRYVFSRIDQETLEINTRLDWTFTPKISLQLFLQPFISTGAYTEFKELSAPRTFDFDRYGENGSTIAYDPNSAQYLVDPDGAGGAASPFTFGNPDFNYKSLRGNLIARWEYLPGSAVYFVWTQNRADETMDGRFRPSENFRELGRAKADNVFLVKFTYWWNP